MEKITNTKDFENGVLVKETIITEPLVIEKKASEETPFDSFQMEEYKNISNSHYESTKQISTFFRYYILILAAPVFILNLVSTKDKGITDFLLGQGSARVYNVVFLYFTIISFIGYFIYLYVINLRLDAILYAKAVNKVRRYFYDSSSLSIKDYNRYLHLPIVSTRPKYSEKTFFVPLLFVFSIINCGLFFTGFAIKMTNSNYFGEWSLNFDFPLTSSFLIVCTFCFFLLHILGYIFLAHLRTNHYLKSYTIGIDIDGVLNNQTKHFKDWLKKYFDKDLDLSLLKEVPVSINNGINVSDEEEKIIFNTKEYWENLPFKENAAKRINQFQKQFGFKILFFSYRDWPQYGKNENEINNINAKIRNKNYTPLVKGDIEKVTENWLKKNGLDAVVTNKFIPRLKYKISSLYSNKKSVIIEMGNPYISDTRFWNYFRKAILNKNRFQGANIKSFKFFIEDTAENAIKMANLCEYVFLFDEPYNNDLEKYNYPKNVIRVFSWDDIYKHLKLLS